MGTHLSALTSCTSRRTASITLTKLPHHGHGRASADWTSATRSTRRLVSSHSESIGSFHGAKSASYYALWPEEEEETIHRRFLDGGGGGGAGRGSSFTVDESVGREKGSSTTTSASTSLQRDFDGEGYREDVDSIVDLIDLMHRDVLLLPPTPSDTMTETMMTTTMTSTTGDSRPSDPSSSSTRKLNRELSTRSVKTQSGKWDSSVDNVIADIFDRIYSAKRSS